MRVQTSAPAGCPAVVGQVAGPDPGGCTGLHRRGRLAKTALPPQQPPNSDWGYDLGYKCQVVCPSTGITNTKLRSAGADAITKLDFGPLCGIAGDVDQAIDREVGDSSAILCLTRHFEILWCP
jgi:hypothetical protein